MRPIALLALILLAACETPPARHAAFSDAVNSYAAVLRGEAGRAQTASLPPPPMAESMPAQPQRRTARRGQRAATPLITAPHGPDCARLETLTGLAREHCAAVRYVRVMDDAWRHAEAMAGYVAALRELGSRFDAGIPPERMEELRDAMLDAGARLRSTADISEDQLEPFRPMAAPIGLRPAFMAEMATHGWRLRQQFQTQSEALDSLVDAQFAGSGDRLHRLRWAMAYLRSALEVMTTSNHDALAEISQARRALGS